MRRGLVSLLAMILPLVLLIAGCGGGGGGANTVSGVAAAGAPLVGTVYLKDSSSPAKELSDTIAADGSFSIDVTGLTPPFILKAQGTAGGVSYTLCSFAPGPGIANINPYSNLAVANAINNYNLSGIYTAPTTTQMQTISANLAKSIADIESKLLPLLTLYHAAVNPISDSYTANHLGLDGLLDMVKVTISSTGTVTLTNKLTSAVISTGSMGNVSGWSDPTNMPQPPVVVNVAPDTAIVNTSHTATFTATVSNTTNTQVTWSVVETGGGTITSAGLYTAPATVGTYHVKATSAADPTKYVTAVVTVVTGPAVSITPTTASLITGATKSFTATVTNSTNTSVTWSVVEAAGGSVTQSGVYTAPATTGTYHVRATSAADSTRYATATVTVTMVGVTISPATTSATTSSTKSFTATVTGTSNTSVTWSVVEAGGGTISTSGYYTAPATAGTYHVKATSISDPTKSATATITVTAAPKPFPYGTWVGPNGVSFTVSTLVSSGLTNQYSGSLTYSGGTIAVNGTDPMTQIMEGSGFLAVAVSQVGATSGVVVSFMNTYHANWYDYQLTGVLSISHIPPSSSDYLNLNAVFSKQ